MHWSIIRTRGTAVKQLFLVQFLLSSMFLDSFFGFLHRCSLVFFVSSSSNRPDRGMYTNKAQLPVSNSRPHYLHLASHYTDVEQIPGFSHLHFSSSSQHTNLPRLRYTFLFVHVSTPHTQTGSAIKHKPRRRLQYEHAAMRWRYLLR